MTGALSRRGVAAALAAAALAPAGAARAQSRDGAGMRVQRLAWAGVKLSVGDVDLFVDARAPDAGDGAPGPQLESGAGRRFALATHHHGDHLDLRALQSVLGERGYLVVHEDVARLFDARVLHVQPVRTFEPVFLSRGGGEFVAWCAPASDGFGAPQVSWIIDGGGRRVIHCGDTIWHGSWWDIARAFGPFDAAFLPINGARQITGRYVEADQPMVLTPEQAASAARALGARLAVPLHYGGGAATYIEERNAEQRFMQAASARGVPIRIMSPGDRVTL
jgi:L-ascorbate metabolism protein UlaG (beta-lactamase superfamily)